MFPLLAIAACTVDVPPLPAPPAPAVALQAPAPPTPPVAPTPPTPPTPITPLTPAGRLQDEQNSVDVFKAVAPATVFVTQSQIVTDRWRMRMQEVPAGTGSGFLWDDKGHVVTNYHVIDGASSLDVTLFDQSSWPARLIGGDPRKDVAVLRIDAPPDKLVAVARAPADTELVVGQKALAIGNPFGLDHTLTVGVISALGRETRGYGGVTIRGLIQTDASINPGNSGGPLLDAQGRLIGMNTMIYSPSGSSAGIGFAVPATTVARVVDQIISRGRVSQVGIGVSVVDDRIARVNRIDGVVIEEVHEGTPAHAAGLKGLRMTRRGVIPGDILVAADDVTLHGFDDLYGVLDERAPGDTVVFKVLRDQAVTEVPIAVIELPDGS